MWREGASMSTTGRLLWLGTCIVGGFALASQAALADVSKDECIAANGRGQELRRERNLSAAREQLHLCASASCPAMVRDDCVKRLDELEKAQPSIVFDVKDGRGSDVIDVRVSVDGQLLVDHLDGSPLNVDPGVHVFTFEVAGRPPVSDKLLVREGEIGRHEPVVMSAIPASRPSPLASSAPTSPGASASPPALETPPGAPTGSGSSIHGGLARQKVIGVALGVAGVAGVAVGSAFGLMSGSAWNRARQVCGGSTSACTNVPSGQSYRSSAVEDATVSTIGFIAGGALVATGLVLFFTGREKDATSAFTVAPAVGAQQAGAVLQGRFR